jgi:flavorubredoxin
VKGIEKALEAGGIKVAQPAISVKYVPDEGEMKACYAFGKAFAKKIKEEK